MTAGMPDYRAAPSVQDFENAARRGTPGLPPKDVENATLRAGWKLVRVIFWIIIGPD